MATLHWKRIETVAASDVEAAMAYTLLVSMTGAAHELKLPITFAGDRQSITVMVETEEEWNTILGNKEQFRAALMKRIDVMAVRRAMRLVYATGIEEP